MLVQNCVHYIHQSTAALQDCYHFISSSKIKTNGDFFDCFFTIDNTNDEARDSKVITLSRPTALLNPVNILSPIYSINIWRFENLWCLIYLISLLCDKELYPSIYFKRFASREPRANIMSNLKGKRGGEDIFYGGQSFSTAS